MSACDAHRRELRDLHPNKKSSECECYDRNSPRARTDPPGMSLVMTKIKLTNSLDLSDAKRGLITPDSIRSVEIEAMVDTGAFGLCIPQEIVDLLGVQAFTQRPARTADGRTIEVPVVGPLDLEVLGRSMLSDAMVLPRGTQALLGAIPLEYMDLVVIPKTGDVITNPAHPDGPVYRI